MNNASVMTSALGMKRAKQRAGNGFYWQHRVLPRRVEGSNTRTRWICLTPDDEFVLTDLEEIRHVVLQRNA
eukprot:6573469-Heterocapsa_arctica.AAC.1